MHIDIQHIAKLSRLRIEVDQLEKFEKDMEAIVAMVDRLPDVHDELTLDAEHPMHLREDVAVEHKFNLVVWLCPKQENKEEDGYETL